jgi:glycosyltransferase involved in cell wall biosynthesis
LKICVVGVTYPYRGGIAHYTTLLCRELSKKHEVLLVSMRRQYPRLLFPGKSQTNEESSDRISFPSERLLDSLWPWSWLRAARRIRTFSPDLVIVQWWQPFLAFAFGVLARRLKSHDLPLAFVCHNVKPHESSWIDGLLTRFALLPGDFFLVHSEEDRRNLLALKPGAKVSKAFHPTYETFARGKTLSKEEAKSRLDLTGPVVLFFGFIRPYKGLIHLIRAFAGVVERRDAKLLVVGEFYESSQPYKKEVKDLGLGDRVRFVDRYVPNEEVALYFSASDVVALPYLSATQSGIVQIAYGFKKPVVVTEVGGLREVVSDGETGRLVPPGDPGALAEAILSILNHESQETLEENIEVFRERFSWEEYVNLVEELVADS